MALASYLGWGLAALFALVSAAQAQSGGLSCKLGVCNQASPSSSSQEVSPRSMEEFISSCQVSNDVTFSLRLDPPKDRGAGCSLNGVSMNELRQLSARLHEDRLSAEELKACQSQLDACEAQRAAASEELGRARADVTQLKAEIERLEKKLKPVKSGSTFNVIDSNACNIDRITEILQTSSRNVYQSDKWNDRVEVYDRKKYILFRVFPEETKDEINDSEQKFHRLIAVLDGISAVCNAIFKVRQFPCEQDGQSNILSRLKIRYSDFRIGDHNGVDIAEGPKKITVVCNIKKTNGPISGGLMFGVALLAIRP